MANYLKLFEDENAYSAFTGTSAYVTPNVSVCSGGGGSIFYNPYEYNPANEYFTTVAKSNGTIRFNGSASGTVTNKLSYSLNGGSWSTPSQTPSVSVSAGDKVLWKGECIPNSSAGIGNFRQTKTDFDIEGNVMSLLYGDGFKGKTSLVGNNNAFRDLFYDSFLNSAENLSLPATTLAQSCYVRMFYECPLLTTAPSVLPATALTQSCYSNMFKGCTSLTKAPALPATTLAQTCYQNMFNGCTSLTTAPELPAETLADYCYATMFESCIKLATAPELPAEALAPGCYSGMFSGCTSLTTAPVLPAKTLARACYESMFDSCTSLATATELPATTLANSCYSKMFSGCTSLTSAPELPATTLTQYCYYYMFFGCGKINSITCLATDISASNCTTCWLYGVASTGTFKKAASMTSWTSGANGIPDGWTTIDK